MKYIKLILIALGLYILYATVRDVGVENLWQNIASLGWKLTPLFLFYGLVFAFNTYGWGFAFPNGFPKVPFRDLYAIRIIGETLNGIIPFSASLGGEPFKVELLKRRHNVPLAEGYASILIVHTTFWISLNLFVIGGILIAGRTRPLTPVLANSLLVFLITLGSAALVLAIGLYFGVFIRVHALGEKWKLWGALSDEKKQRFAELDTQIHRYYKDPGNVVKSTLFNFLAWSYGAFETWYTAWILGMPLSFTDAWMFEALIQVLRITTFFVPSSIGMQEGGIVFIFSQYGFPNALSLSYAVVRRLREIIWTGLALVIWSFWKERKAKAA